MVFVNTINMYVDCESIWRSLCLSLEMAIHQAHEYGEVQSLPRFFEDRSDQRGRC